MAARTAKTRSGSQGTTRRAPLQPHPGRQWAEHAGRDKDPDREPRPRRRATYTRRHGVRHLFAAYDLTRDKLYGHIKPRKNRTRLLEFCRYLRSLYPPDTRIVIVLDNVSPHLTTKKDTRVGDWAAMLAPDCAEPVNVVLDFRCTEANGERTWHRTLTATPTRPKGKWTVGFTSR
ncbi:hypothetical protein GCM10011428_66330 [Streptomyces violaceus]